MGNRILSAFVESPKTHKQLKDDTARMFQSLGGNILETAHGFRIVGGTFGTSMSFTANLAADVILRQVKENKYELQIFLTWSWSSLMWIVLILGVLLGGVPWLMLILYLFFDPAPAYNQALYRIVNSESF